jgi:anti-anti-sigma regulatory factor
MAVQTIPGWTLQVDRGPEWLFVRPIPPRHGDTEEVDLADALWSICHQHLTYRLVLELDEVLMLRSWLIGQLVMLHKRIATHDGLLRICKLSNDNQQVLRFCRLDDHFPQYADRCAAVMGNRPMQPR